MRRLGTMFGTVAMLMFVAGVFAQGKDFSGTWTVDADKTAAANPAAPAGGGGGGGRAGGGGGGGRGGGGPMTIAMDAKSLKITTTGPNGDTVATYALDGTVSKNAGGRGGETETKCSWDGSKLKMDTTSQGQNGPQTTTAWYYLDSGSLVREQAIAARGDVPASTRKTIYKKG